MRVLRTLLGLVLVVAGMAALFVATIGWNAMSHRDGEGRFTATLEPVSTEGYAIVVPDLRDQAQRFGLGGLLGDGSLRFSAVASSAPVVLVVAPMAEVDRYLAEAARTEITAVGYADGPQPVSTVAIAGNAVPGPIRYGTFSSSPGTGTVEWTPAGDDPVSLIVLRADGLPGLAATIAVGRDAGWLTTLTWVFFAAGVFAVFGGLGALFWPAATREMVLVLEAHRMVDFADRIAEKVSGAKRGRTRPEVVHRMPMHDLTGEVVAIAADAYQPTRTGAEADPTRRTGSQPHPPRTGLTGQAAEGWSGPGRDRPNRRRDNTDIATHRRNRRDGWRDRDRGESRRDFVATNQRDPSGLSYRRGAAAFDLDPDVAEYSASIEEADFDAGAYDDRTAVHAVDDPTGESPYVQTAT